MKRFFWSLSGIFALILMLFAFSVPVGALSLPTGAGHMSNGSANLYDGRSGTNVSCFDRIGQYLVCRLSGNLTTDQWFSGFDLNLTGTIPSSAISVFTLQFNVTSSYFTKFEFNGFVSNNSYEVVILDQQIQERTSEVVTIQFTVYNYRPMQRISLRSSSGAGLAFSFATPGTTAGLNISDISYTTVLSGTSLEKTLNDILGSLKSSNSTLEQILQNGIKVDMDTSGLATSQGQQATTDAVNNAANQAHKDSQAQLEESKKQTQIAEEQKNFVTDTSTPEASDIANSSTIPSSGLLPDGPLDSILLLPVNILNSMIQSLGGSCTPIEAPLPYVDEKIVLPCFNDSVYKGSFEGVGTIIGGIGSAIILYGYFKHLYKKVDRAVSMETTDEDEWGIL